MIKEIEKDGLTEVHYEGEVLFSVKGKFNSMYLNLEKQCVIGLHIQSSTMYIYWLKEHELEII